MDKRMLSIIQDYFTTQPVVKAWIFGSFARGEANDQSDIDILVTLDKNAHMGLMGFAAMSVDLEGMLNRTVDIVVDDCVKSFARESVDADKMLIYERASQTVANDVPKLKAQIQEFLSEYNNG